MKRFLQNSFWRLAGFLWVTLAVSIILVAIIVGLGRVLVPLADHVRPQVESILSEQTGQPVSVRRLEAEWPGLTPRFTLHDLVIGQMHVDGNGLRIEQANLEFSLSDAFRADRNLARLVLVGLEVVVRQREDGRWQAGIEQEAGEGDLGILRLGDVHLRDARLRLQPGTGQAHVFHTPEMRLQRAGDELGLEGIIQGMEEDSGRFQVRLLVELQQDMPVGLKGWVEGRILPAAWPVADMDFLPWVEETGISLEAWLEWELDGPARLDADLQARNWPKQGAGTADLNARLAATYKEQVTRFELDGKILPEEDEQESAFRLGGGRTGSVWALEVDTLELALVHQLATPWVRDSALEAYWPDRLAGRLEGVVLAGDDQGSLHGAEGFIHALEVSPVQRAPGVRSLDLALSLDGDLLALAPAGDQVVVDWPAMLRESAQLSTIDGKLLLGPGWVGFDRFFVENEEVSATVEGWVGFGGPTPFMDFEIRVPRARVSSLYPYLPVGIMPDPSVEWLDRAIPGGARASGDLRFFGPADTFPWEYGGGEFVSRVDLEWTDLDFAPGWPVGRDLSGEMYFSGTSLDGRTRQGRISGIEVNSSRIWIENMRAPVIEMDFDVSRAPLPGLMDFLREAPLELELGEVDELALEGETGLDLNIVLPIGQVAEGAWTLDGNLDLAGAGVEHREGWFRLDGLAGHVPFGRNAFGPASLTGRLNGHPVDLALSGSPGESARLDLTGTLPLSGLFPPEGFDRQLIDELAPGASFWQVGFSRIDETHRLQATSELENTALKLPAPFAKEAGQRWPVTLELEPDSIRLEMHQRLAASLVSRSNGGEWRLGARLGDEAEEDSFVPEPGEGQDFAIDGSVGTIDLPGWGRLAGLLDGNGEGRDLNGSVALHADRVAFGRAYLADVSMNLNRDQQHWILAAAAPSVQGQVRLPAGSGAGRIMVADFEQLHLQLEPLPDEVPEELPDEPAEDRINPGTLPALHFLVEDLRYGDLDLGRARLEAHPVDGGIEIEQIQTTAELAEINGRGRWMQTDEGTESTFDLRLSSQDLAALLFAAGFDSSLEEGRSRLELSGSWPGNPAAFSLARISGQLDLLIEDGSIPEASPGGAGRLLGLVSLGSLPRRIQLDFRDVFGQGLSFDRVEGQFELGEGRAYTDEIRISTASADIRISGMTDLVARTYDQEILIQPGLGSTLPILGMLAAGPGGAAAGLALQGLIGRPLGELSEIRYRVTGPWDDPEVIVVGARAEDDELISPGLPDDAH